MKQIEASFSFIGKQKTGEMFVEITFVRHGPSCCKSQGRCSVKQFKEWVKSYDEMGILQEPVVPLDTIRKCQDSSVIITSSLVRAVESTRVLLSGIEKKTIQSKMFREAELPIIDGIPSFIRLKPSCWAFLFRFLWMAGYGGKKETFRQARRRAEKASGTLMEYARIHGKVVVVGHGIFNRMVAKALIKKGWQGEYPPGRHHFCCTTYVQPEENYDSLLNGNG